MNNSKPYFIIVALLFYLVSCSDDDNDLTITLEGTVWVFKSETISCDNPNNNETLECTATDCQTLFFANGILTITEIVMGFTTTETRTYTISGNTISINYSVIIIEYTFTIVSTTLTLVLDDDLPGCISTLTFEKQ